MIRTLARAFRRLALGLVWLVLAVAMSLGGAGIVAQVAHPPGSAAREELTYGGDRALQPKLDAARTDLEAIRAKVDDLATLARAALTAVRDADATALEGDLASGAVDAAALDGGTRDLRETLDALPGDHPTDALIVSAALLGRRAAMLAALDAATGLSTPWQQLSGRGRTAVTLTRLLTDHDTTVAKAAASGRSGDYAAALSALATATTDLDGAAALRDELKPTTDVTILDEWLTRNRAYDAALTTLYASLKASGGKITDAVKAAYTAEATARSQLPPDPRGLVVIVGDIARGGLNQAVIAIEQARGRLDLALQMLATPAG